MTRICAVDECDREVEDLDWCHRHYERKRRTGSPTGTNRRTPAQRFWAKVEKTDTCWLWRGAITSRGYGSFFRGNGLGAVGAHCWAYESLVGEIPDRLQLDHLCRNRACVNPAHLEPVTARVNRMRGVGPQRTRERFAAMTHCKRGHPRTPENMFTASNGTHNCRPCARLLDRARRAA